ncbi:MAG: VOC family protein [Achromobacter sp.]
MYPVGRTEFDHAVIMVRDQLDTLSPHYERQGFSLSDVAVHNLGSCNRLIALENLYIELLGWPAGKPPARKEIADSAFGLEALVFRTADAQATFERLSGLGFDVNPVQELSRSLVYQGETVDAKFQTVRFAKQPIPGLRMYFCRHLTPEYVWVPELMAHANGARTATRIDVAAPDAAATAALLARVVDVPARQAEDHWEIALANLTLSIRPDAGLDQPRPASITIENREGMHYLLDVGTPD